MDRPLTGFATRKWYYADVSKRVMQEVVSLGLQGLPENSRMEVVMAEGKQPVSQDSSRSIVSSALIPVISELAEKIGKEVGGGGGGWRRCLKDPQLGS